MLETQPTGDQFVSDLAPETTSLARRMWGIAAGAASALGLSLLVHPLSPVLGGIALTARFGKSPSRKHGFLYGAVIGPTGFIANLFVSRPDPALALWEQALMLAAVAGIFGWIGIGINNVLNGRGSVIGSCALPRGVPREDGNRRSSSSRGREEPAGYRYDQDVDNSGGLAVNRIPRCRFTAW